MSIMYANDGKYKLIPLWLSILLFEIRFNMIQFHFQTVRSNSSVGHYVGSLACRMTEKVSFGETQYRL